MAASTEPHVLYQGVNKHSAGYKLLTSMGWKEGEGLGANKQGIKTHVKVKKKHDASGVGANEAAVKLRDWTVGMMHYDQVLSGLKEIPAKRPTASDGDDSDSSEDNKVSKANQKGKHGAGKRRKQQPASDSSSSSSSSEESSSSSDSSSSSSSSSDSSSSDDESQPTSQSRKAATHIGRYRKRETAKMVRGYSNTDLAAILGANVVPGGAFVAVAAVKQQQEEEPSKGRGSSSSNSGSSDDDGSDSGTEADDEQDPAGRQAGAETAARRASEQQQQQQETEEGPAAWWASMFVKAGRMGNAQRESKQPKIRVHGFSEQDQTALYMQAHDGKVQNRQGLGRSSMPKKVAGARWEGKKTIIEYSDDDQQAEEEEQQQEEEEQEEEQEEQTGLVVIMPKSQQQGASAQQPDLQTLPAGKGVKGKRGASPEQAPQQQAGQQQKGSKKGKRKERKQKHSDAAAAAAPAAASHEGGSKSKKQKKSKQQEQQQQQDGQGRQQAAEHAGQEGKQGSKSKKRSNSSEEAAPGKRAKTAAADSDAVLPASPASSQQVKWKKLAAQVLADAPMRRLKASKLHKQVLALAGGVPGSDSEQLMALMLKKLRKCSGFEVQEKHVVLCKV